jgi:arginase
MPSPPVIVEAPSVLGLRPTGVEKLPDALRAAQLHSRLNVSDVHRVRPLPYDDRRDEATGMLNPRALVEYTHQLADVVTTALERGARPLVLGGDCTILLGNLLALRRRGQYGLLFLDGHADFYQPEANVNGEAASSELALATGRGPASLTAFDGYRPLVEDAFVVAIGMRDAEEAHSYGSQSLPDTIRQFDLATLRHEGITRTAEESIAHFRERSVDGIWIHFDVDVLDDAIMPAVDYRLPGGLTWSEAESLLRSIWTSGLAVGMDVTIFNPTLDADGYIARALVEFLERTLSASSASR